MWRQSLTPTARHCWSYGHTVDQGPELLLSRVKENTENFLGMNGDGINSPLDGQLDEVRLWRVARTEAEIREHMFESLTGREEGLVALWNFDDPANPGPGCHGWRPRWQARG